MATTTNFGWETPDDTDLVKDGAAAIRTALGGVDTSFIDLKGGTTGQVLAKASNTDLDYSWVTTDDANAIQNAIVDAKGDLIAATANDTPARLAVGTNYAFLQADSTQSTGLKWENSAWTAYTPTVTSGTGTFTSVTAGGAWKRIGTVIFVRASITITTNGTAGGDIKITLPASNVGSDCMGVFREQALTGNCGIIQVQGSNAIFRTFTNGYPGGTGYVLTGSMTYEVA